MKTTWLEKILMGIALIVLGFLVVTVVGCEDSTKIYKINGPIVIDTVVVDTCLPKHCDNEHGKDCE